MGEIGRSEIRNREIGRSEIKEVGRRREITKNPHNIYIPHLFNVICWMKINL